jgi:hypothetical protein
MPASTRILVQALATIAQFPRLPLASIETHTLMLAAYAHTLWIGSNFLVIRYLSAGVRRPRTSLRNPKLDRGNSEAKSRKPILLSFPQSIHSPPHNQPIKPSIPRARIRFHSTIKNLKICILKSEIRNPKSTINNQQSTINNHQSSINNHQYL